MLHEAVESAEALSHSCSWGSFTSWRPSLLIAH